MTASTRETTSTMRRHRLAVASAFLVHGAVAGSWATRIPSVKHDLGLGDGALGLALAGPAVGALLAMPLGGAVTARRGSRSIVRIMLIAYCAALVLPVLARSLPLLFLALLLLGASGGTMDVAMNAQGVALEKLYGRPILSSFHSMWSLGGFAGALTGGLAIDVGLASETHLVLAAALFIAVGLRTTTALMSTEADRSAAGPRFARPSRALAVIAAITLVAMLGEGAALDWSALYLRESLSSGSAAAAGALAGFSLGMALGRLLGDGLTARFGAVAFVRGAGIVAVLGVALALALHEPTSAIIGFTVFGIGLSSIVPVAFGRAGRSTGVAAPAIAAVATVGYSAFLLGPSLVGAVAEITTLRTGLAVVACVVALIPVLAGFMPRVLAPSAR